MLGPTSYITGQTRRRLDGIDLIPFNIHPRNIIDSHNKRNPSNPIPTTMCTDGEFAAWLYFTYTLRTYAEILQHTKGDASRIIWNRVKLIVHAAHTIIHDELAGITINTSNTICRYFSSSFAKDGTALNPSVTDVIQLRWQDKLLKDAIAVGTFVTPFLAFYSTSLRAAMQVMPSVLAVGDILLPSIADPVRHNAFRACLTHAMDAAFCLPFNDLSAAFTTQVNARPKCKIVALGNTTQCKRPVIPGHANKSMYPPPLYKWMRSMRVNRDAPDGYHALDARQINPERFVRPHDTTKIKLSVIKNQYRVELVSTIGAGPGQWYRFVYKPTNDRCDQIYRIHLLYAPVI